MDRLGREAVAITGLGIGISFAPTFIAIQYSVDPKQIGIASSLGQFMGNLGGTIGLAILGSVQVNTLSSKLMGVVSGLPAQAESQASPILGMLTLLGRYYRHHLHLLNYLNKILDLQN